MASLNKVMLIGNLGRDPESRELQSGMATNFSIATTRRYRFFCEQRTSAQNCAHARLLYGRGLRDRFGGAFS